VSLDTLMTSASWFGCFTEMDSSTSLVEDDSDGEMTVTNFSAPLLLLAQ